MFVNGVQNDEFEKHKTDELCIQNLFSLLETKRLTLHIRFRSKLRSAVIEETWNRVRVRGGGLNFWGKRVFLNIITETESNYECKRKHYMNHSISRGVFLEALNGWFFWNIGQKYVEFLQIGNMRNMGNQLSLAALLMDKWDKQRNSFNNVCQLDSTFQRFSNVCQLCKYAFKPT